MSDTPIEETAPVPAKSIVTQAVSAVQSIGTSAGGAAIASGTVNIIADMIEYIFQCVDAGHIVHPSGAIEFQMATGVLFFYHGLRARALARAAKEEAKS